jgi:hypothetical protein
MRGGRNQEKKMAVERGDRKNALGKADEFQSEATLAFSHRSVLYS